MVICLAAKRLLLYVGGQMWTQYCSSWYYRYYYTLFQKNGHPFYFFHNSLK